MDFQRSLSLLLFLLLLVPAHGLKEEGASGMVIGQDMSFRVTAPPGWVLDDESCVQTGFGAVVYPVGGSMWDDPGPLITNAIYNKARDYEMKQVTAELQNPRKLPGLTTSDGRSAKVFDYGNGKFGRVAYVDTPQSVCEIALTAPDKASFEKAIPAFEAVVRSYRYYGPNSGEHLAFSTIDGLLHRTAEVSDYSSPPTGWESGPSKPGVTVYKRVEGSSYGVIAVYAPKPSEGNPQTDYEIAWRHLAWPQTPAPAPKPSNHDFGWQMRTGETTRLVNGQPLTTLVTVYSGYGKYTAVHLSYTDTSYRPEIDKFLAGHVYPAGSTSGGDWTFRNIGNYDRQIVNGKRETTSYASRSYRFGSDTYTLEGAIGSSSGEIIELEERGTFSIVGNKLTLRGQGGTRKATQGDGSSTSKPLPPWERTYTFRLVVFEDAIHGPHLVLEGVEENDIDGAYSSYVPNAFVYVLGYH